MLSAATDPEFEELKRDCENLGLDFSTKAADALSRSSYLPMCESVGRKQDDWSREFIEKRSKRIAELAWDELAPWLELEQA